MKVEEVKNAFDVETYIDGCLNDFKFGLASQRKTNVEIAKLITHLLERTQKAYENQKK